MKKSEFKELVKEAMMEILPELMEIMAENLSESWTPPQSVRQTPDLTLVRQHASQASGGGHDYGLDENFLPARPRARSSAPTPNNPKEMIDGEVFASGQGIMEWYQKAGGKAQPSSEFKHTPEQMEDFMKKKFGV